MNKVFVDTWAWYALTDTANADHVVAQLANDELIEAESTFVTTNFVCTSFAVMRALGLTRAFTADHHFATVGFILTP